eukprot:CCRYP_009752-RA/>CCRYP_009752-RA protein AED:0.38 eAED:0.38 QI:241/1/1/1/0/0.25/4/67/37
MVIILSTVSFFILEQLGAEILAPVSFGGDELGGPLNM